MLPINPLKKTYIYDNKTLLGYIEDRKVSGSGGYLQYIKRLGNLLAVYPFIEDVKDYSGNGYDGSISGGLTFTSGGLMGQNAITASAQVDYVDVASSGLLAAIGTAPELTVSYWAKVVDGDWTNSAGKNFFRFQYDATNYLQALIASGNNELYLYATATATKLKNFAYHNEGWIHIVTTVSNANARVRHYINGRKIYEAADWAGLASAPTAGQIFNAAGSQGFGTGGSQMAWFAVWGKELAESDVSLLYRKAEPGYSLHQKILNHAPFVYLPLNETAGAVAYDYGSAGYNGATGNVTVNQPGMGDGMPSYYCSPTTPFAYINLGGTDLVSNFPKSEGGLMVFCKPWSSALWTDGVEAGVCRFRQDGSNFIYMSKTNTGNQDWLLYYTAGGVADGADITQAEGGEFTDWAQVAMGWSVAADSIYGYLNGVSIGTSATLGTWAVGNIDAAFCGFASQNPNSSNSSAWKGWLAKCVIFNRCPSDVEYYELKG